MKINYDGQLITTSFTVTFRGRVLRIDDVIIDTGSSHTIISPDILEEIGVTYETGDSIYEAYGIGGSVPFYTVGILPKDHKGLLGLDILKQHSFIIDLKTLELRT